MTLVSHPAALAHRLPPTFVWGAATSAFQIEGARDAEGKSSSIWDTFCRVPGAISTGETGDPACDHYRRWREDVDLMSTIGLDAYRFSVSWPRVIPDGVGTVNERGIAFYDRLTDALLARGIRPFVTLYHWDLPQALQDRGGWTSRETVDAFASYADVVARRLGDRVRDWITINEPQIIAFLGHHQGIHAPGVRDLSTALLVSHHMLLAHRAAAAAVRAPWADARIGIALNLSPCEAASGSAADVAAATRMDGYLARWFLDPLYARGYPVDMAAVYAPYFDRASEMTSYDGALDFLGVNYYSRHLVRVGAAPPLHADRVRPEPAERTAMGWEVHERSLTDLLIRLARDYSPGSIHVTENGAAYDDVAVRGVVNDTERVSFLRRHITACAAAVEAGVPLDGYFVWSLLDNFEWTLGTSKRFGLVYVDFETQARALKISGRWYRALIEAHRSVR